MGISRTHLLAGVLALAPRAALLAQTSSPPTAAVSGVFYGQYAFNLRGDAAGHHVNNFDVTRAYLTLTGRFARGVGGRITGDIYRVADGSLSYRLKYAFAQWTPPGSALTLKLGALQTPFIEYNEQLWDYRMQGSDPLDRAGYLSSADFGLTVDGTWRDEGITFSAGAFNGEYYNRAPGDRHKDVAARVSVRLLRSDDRTRLGGLRVTGFALLGEPNGGGTRRRALGQVSYRSSRVILAGLYAATRDRSDTAAVPVTTPGRLVSVFGVVRLGPAPVGLLGRLVVHDPDTGAPGDRQTRVTAGVSYRIGPNLRVLANLDHTTYQGGAPTPALDAARSQALFQAEVVF